MMIIGNGTQIKADNGIMHVYCNQDNKRYINTTRNKDEGNDFKDYFLSFYLFGLHLKWMR